MMEDQLKDLNKTLNQMISPDDKFTDKQRQNIRNAIAKKRSKKLPVLPSNWKPIVSTAACLILIFAVVQVAMDNFSFNNQNSSSDAGNDSGANEAAFHSGQKSGDSDGPSMDKAMPALDEEDRGGNKLDGTKDDFSITENSDGQQKTISGPLFPLDERLLLVYEQLKADQNQDVLRGLEPFEVMQVYYHALQQKDYETIYIMYYQDPAGSMPSKQQYLDDLAKDPNLSKNNQKKLEQIQEIQKFNQIIQKTPMDRKEAYITWGGTEENMKFFRLIRDDSKGVWAVSWLASQ